MVYANAAWWVLSKLAIVAAALVWAIWGLLGALPGGTIIRGAVAITLLYSSGLLHFSAPLFGYDLTVIDNLIMGISIPNPLDIFGYG